MAELVADCPRCGVKRITFDIPAEAHIGVRFNWQQIYEAFCICRQCGKTSVHILVQADSNLRGWLQDKGPSDWKTGTVNGLFVDEGVVTGADFNVEPAPEHLPAEIKVAFDEGAKCMRVQCFNAAGTMFRLCVDFATYAMLPAPDLPGGPSARVRRDLGLRLPWLFDSQRLPSELHDLASCIKEDGNDGAHKGTLTEAEALDMLDFATALLERLYTEPKRLELAQARRLARRAPSPAAE